MCKCGRSHGKSNVQNQNSLSVLFAKRDDLQKLVDNGCHHLQDELDAVKITITATALNII